MRVTNRTLTKNYLNDLNRNLQTMSKYQEELSSGKEIRRPSDDPFDVSRSIDLNSSIDRNDQYLKNIQDASDWLKTTDESLGEIGDNLNRLGQLIDAASNGTNSNTELYADKTEIEQIIAGIADIGNTNFAGKYIFAGQKTTTPPFEAVRDVNGKVTGVMNYNGNTGTIKREISPGVTMDINITGDRILAGNLNATLSSIMTALSNGDNKELSNLIDDVENARDNILRIRAEVGAKSNRMDFAEKKNTVETDNITEVLSKFEDIDLVKKTIESKVAENVYQSALMAGAKVLQPTLLEFLK